MKAYPKIETLFDRDERTFRVIPGKWRLPEFAYLAQNKWYAEEKIDGTNIRVLWDHTAKMVTFKGRSDDAQIPGFLLAKLTTLFPSELFAFLYPETSMALYGEGYGAKVQKSGGNYIKDGVDFILFDVFIGDWWLERDNVADIASKLHVNRVPLLYTGSLDAAVTLVADGLVSSFGDFQAEGVVLRPCVQLFNRSGQRIISKLKTKDFTGGKKQF